MKCTDVQRRAGMTNDAIGETERRAERARPKHATWRRSRCGPSGCQELCSSFLRGIVACTVLVVSIGLAGILVPPSFAESVDPTAWRDRAVAVQRGTRQHLR